MRVAVISDLHGNYRALEAVLDQIERDPPDQIICAGDIVNPFLRSLDTWNKLKALKIPCVRGNHEDYVVDYFHSKRRPEIRDSVQFRPVQLVAQHMGQEIAAELANIPMEHVIQGPGGDELFICHASPGQNSRSPWMGIDAPMGEALRTQRAQTFVGGHIHHQWKGEWEGKSLVIAGSVGLPLSGEPKAQYVVLEHLRGAWSHQHKTIAYDQAGALREYRESGALELGGPIAWMLYDELWTAQYRLAHFFREFQKSGRLLPQTMEEWESQTIQFLHKINRWDSLRSVLGRTK